MTGRAAQQMVESLKQELSRARMERNLAQAELAALRITLRAYADSDLVSLATTLMARLDVLETQAQEADAS